MEAEVTIEQGRQSQRLTVLAFLYLPLTFVTGIFGMNVQQINNSPLSIWVPVVVLVVVAMLTLVMFVSYSARAKRHAHHFLEKTSLHDAKMHGG